MALAAAAEVFGAQSVALKHVEFRKVLFLPEGGTRTIQVILSRSADGASPFYIYSRAEGVTPSAKSWMLHATGLVCLQRDNGIITSHTGPETLTEMRTRCVEEISGQDYYRRLRERGIHYGPFFQSIVQLWRNDGAVLGEVQVPDVPATGFNGRFSGLRLQRKRRKAADKTSTYRPASTSSRFTVVRAVIYGVTPGCSIGR